MKDYMQFWLEKQIEVQQQIARTNNEFIDLGPEVRLNLRKRGNRQYYRQVISKGKELDCERSITDQPLTIAQLLQKEISVEAIRRCEHNVRQMKQLENQYLPLDTMAIKETIPQKYHHLLKPYQDVLYNHWSNLEYDKREDPYNQTIHTTRKGEMVASKSEVIIANGLFENDIPYHYDERSDVTNEWGNYYYPDFTIVLPNGEKIYWEHFGLLTDWEYLQRAMKKLSHYHRAGITIGRNLIITVDDGDGNCDSLAIYNIIRYILAPHFN